LSPAPATDTFGRSKRADVLVVIGTHRLQDPPWPRAEAALGQAQRKVQGYFANRDGRHRGTTAAKAASVDRPAAAVCPRRSRSAKARNGPGPPPALVHDGAVSGDD